jgi:hypothetical protein
MKLTNLLPEDRQKALTREYLLRLSTVTLFFVAVLLVIHAALLAPSYLYLTEEAKAREAHLSGVASSLATSEGNELGTRVSALTTKADALISLSSAPSAAEAVRRVLSVPLGGVRVHGIALTLPENGEGQMRIMGTAPTRDSLRQYFAALEKLPGVSHADLPLSVYAEERDLPFSITLSGSFTP